MPEALLIILDVGLTMADGRISPTHFEAAKKAVMMLIQQKVIYNPKDEIGLVLFGTEETDNTLYEEDSDQYSHIVAKRDLTIADLEFVRTLEDIEPGGAQGDIVDSIIVAMDMLIRHTNDKKKARYEKRIMLITDAATAISEPDDIEVVLQQFQSRGVRLDVIGLDFCEEEEGDDDEDDDEAEPPQRALTAAELATKTAALVAKHPGKSEAKIRNELLLRNIAGRVGGFVIPISCALKLIAHLKKKTVAPRTTYRGEIEIAGGAVRLPIWTYAKIYENKFPTLKKLSLVALKSRDPDTLDVKMQRSYFRPPDLEHEVPEEERIKGFRYGKDIVQFSKADEDVLKYKAEKGMQLIGFARAADVPRHLLMGNAELVIPAPTGREEAQVGLSALIHALFEMDKVAIVRFVKTAGGRVILGALFPSIKLEYENLYFVSLPFAEDIRQYQFPSFPTERKHQPSEAQLAAADQLIHAMDLTEAAVDEEGAPMEAIKPKYTYNPVLQHFHQCLQSRALHPEEPLSGLDPFIERYVNPDVELLAKADPSIQAFKERFPLTKAEEKPKRRLWRDTDEEINLDSYADGGAADAGEKRPRLEGESIQIGKATEAVDQVRSVDPVADFRAMCGRRDQDLVETAIEQMTAMIHQLVRKSINGSFYPRAFDCLGALRSECIKSDESARFNAFLHELKGAYSARAHTDFWRLVVDGRVTLVSHAETEDSAVSQEEADRFHAEGAVAPAPPVEEKLPEPEDDGEDAEDLLAMM